MLLVADIGNTNITLGVFDEQKLIKTYRLASDKTADYEVLLQDLLKNCDVTSCIIASVVDELDEILKKAVDKVFKINSIVFNSNLNCGVKISVPNPQKVGLDRIANACGALSLYGKPAIVVDLGTATTFDIINKDGCFVGGVIMAGLKMQLRALNEFTSKLPNLEVAEIDVVIGTNTEENMLSGVIRGSACAIEGLISQCEKELGEKAVIIATGGYSSLISKYMTRKFDYINPNLTLEGLRFLYEINKM